MTDDPSPGIADLAADLDPEAAGPMILYRTLARRDRPGPYGAAMRAFAARPMVAGALLGLGAVGIALARSFAGAARFPGVAAAISGAVVLVWVVLFRLMRGFFAQQGAAQVSVRRCLALVEDDQGQAALWWTQGEDEVLARITRPAWRLLRKPGKPGRGNGDGERAWPVWVVAGGTNASFVLETRALWSEARTLAAEDLEPDEFLPAHIASPLLELARR